MTILVTGTAGFIGMHTAKALLDAGHRVIGIDNINSYYETALKYARLDQLTSHKDFTFYKCDIADQDALKQVLEPHKKGLSHIIHLAAQPGVRYSLQNPHAYIQSNIVAHLNMLEFARYLDSLDHFVYASSSSVYGNNTKQPFAVEDPVEQPISLYAATKRSDELISFTYSHLYDIPATGLRFFTVYGPWGRPDMAPYLFTKAIFDQTAITLFNNGKLKRDFTYIDDIVKGTLAAMNTPPTHMPAHAIYNLGNHKPVWVTEFVSSLEDAIGKKAIIEPKPMQPGDVDCTYADITSSQKELGFNPMTDLDVGLTHFVEWYKHYHSL